MANPGADAAGEPDDEAPYDGEDEETDAGDEQDALLAPSPTKSRKGSKRSRSKASSKPNVPRRDKACDYRTPVWEHVVAPGEHLGLIAGRYGVLSKDLVDLNPELSGNPNLIRVGQKLKVCPEIAPRDMIEVKHVVAKGEHLAGIAKQYHLTLEELMEFQSDRIADPNKIRVGQELVMWVEGDIKLGFRPEDLANRKHTGKRPTVQLPRSKDYVVKRPRLAYGTERTIHLLQSAIRRYNLRAGGGPKVRVGDLSKKGGGRLEPHLSHRDGTDVDVGLIMAGEDRDAIRFRVAREDNLDVHRTWLLVQAFLETGHVRYIFLDYKIQERLYHHAKKLGVSEKKLDEYFQYPRGVGRNHGIVRHWRSHRGHIHVRFKN